MNLPGANHGTESMKQCRRNRIRLWSVAGLSHALSLFLAFAAMAEGLDYAVDPATGHALGGNDPLSYFISGKPRSGNASIEYRWGGAVWVFVNEGNRDAFASDPDVYAPQFSGCDPQALSEGYSTIGNPTIFAIIDSRLYLFHSEVNRFLFLSNPSLLLEEARTKARSFDCRTG